MSTGQLIPLSPLPNQTFSCALNVDGAVLNLTFTLRYNVVAGYWIASVFDGQGTLLLDSLPFITGAVNGSDASSMNILGQFAYLVIGSAVLANASGVTAPDYPNSTDLGTDYVLLWGNTP